MASINAGIELPPEIEWTNEGEVGVIDRERDLRITWSGGNAGTEFVFVAGFSRNANQGVMGNFLCTAAITDGSLIVTERVLRQIPRPCPVCIHRLTC